MPSPSTTSSAAPGSRVCGTGRPVLSGSVVSIALRYLVHKKLSYLAALGVALSVGTLIIVMSVFTGFHIQLTQAVRGYLSDMTAEPVAGGLYALEDWELWREKALQVAHVRAAAPYINGAGLIREAGTGKMRHVMFKGVRPELEGTVARLPEYMAVGEPADLDKTYPNPDGGRLRSCFVGAAFFQVVPEDIDRRPRELVLVTATPDLRLQLKKYAVNGVFRTGSNDYDSQVVILGLETAADLVDSGGAVSGLSIRLDDYEDAQMIREALYDALAPGTVLKHLPAGNPVLAALSGDGRRFVEAGPQGAVVREVLSGEQLLSAAPAAGPPTAAALDREGSALLLGYADGAAYVLRLDGPGGPLEAGKGQGAVTAACFSPDGFLAAVGHESGTVRILDAETGEELLAVEQPAGGVRGVAFDADSAQLIAANEDGSAHVWDAESGRRVALLTGQAGSPPLASAAFSPDGSMVLTASRDGRLALWSRPGQAPLLHWQTDAAPLLSAGFGWTSDVVVAAGERGLRSWYVRRFADVGVVGPYAALEDAGRTLAGASFTADGRRALTLDPDGTAQLTYTGAGFRIVTWEEQRQTFLEAVAMERFLQALIMSLILVLAEFVIFSILTTMVNERRRDVGILKAVGFTSGQVCQVFLLCGLTIGLAGAALGVAGGLLFADNINAIRELIRQTIKWDPFPPTVYYFDRIPAHVGFWMPVIVAGGAVVCSLLFGIIPAVRAARLDPVQTLHYE